MRNLLPIVCLVVLVGCKEPPVVPNQPSPASPQGWSCSVTISAISGRVSAMTWTNAATGHSGSVGGGGMVTK